MRTVTAAKIVLLVSWLSSSAFSQITVSQQDLLGLIGRTQTFESLNTGGAEINIGTPGGPQVWDFTTFNFPFNTLREQYHTPQATPFGASFPAANLAVQLTVSLADTVAVYLYAEISPENIGILGTVVATPNTLYVYRTRSFTNTSGLPITYGKSWQTTVVTTFEISGLINYDSTVTQSTVDAWGTARLPLGEIACLRIHDREISYQTTFFNGQPLARDTSFSTSYTWRSKNNLDVAAIPSAGTFNRLVSSAQTAVSEDQASAFTPARFELAQNYPNPFNPSTQISFALPSAQRVTLKVFDLSGKEIATLLNDAHKAAGVHALRFEAHALPSGVYFYRVNAGEYVATRKLLLVR